MDFDDIVKSEIMLIPAQFPTPEYEKLQMLGHGAFGKVRTFLHPYQVYLVKSHKTDELCVMKQMSTFGKGPEEVTEMMRESSILRSLDHPNIIRFVDVFIDSKEKLNIIMEYASGGDLSRYLKQCAGKPIPESQVVEWTLQLCDAIAYLQSKKIMHRDLKCENVFLTDDNQLKLGDFGISKVLQQTQEKAKTFVGTPYYLSPEILEGKPYSFSSDMWSLGIIIYEMLALSKPFEADSLHFLALKIIKGKYKQLSPSLYSQNIRNVVKSLLQVWPSKRPSIDEVTKQIQHLAQGMKKQVKQIAKNIEIDKAKKLAKQKQVQALKMQEDKRKLEKKQQAIETEEQRLAKKREKEQKQREMQEVKKKLIEEGRQKCKANANEEVLIEQFGSKRVEEVSTDPPKLAQKGGRKQKEIVVQIYLPKMNSQPQQEDPEPIVADEMVNEPDIRQLNDAEELSLQYISTETTKPEDLRQLLEESLGVEVFKKAHEIIRQKVEEMDLDEIEEKYSSSGYVELLPFLSQSLIERFLPMLFTLIIIQESH